MGIINKSLEIYPQAHTVSYTVELELLQRGKT